MNVDFQNMVKLERANYQGMQKAVAELPEMDLCIRKDVILSRNPLLPVTDANHACLLQTTKAGAGPLLDEIIDYYDQVKLPAAIFISKACQPADWENRLKQRGFTSLGYKEVWLAHDLDRMKPGKMRPGISVMRIGPAQVDAYTETFCRAFGMPEEYVEILEGLVGATVHVPGHCYYLAYHDGTPIACCLTFSYDQFGFIGSFGVLPSWRKSAAAINLSTTVLLHLKEQGLEYALGFTQMGRKWERLLRIFGFRRALIREGYVRK